MLAVALVTEMGSRPRPTAPPRDEPVPPVVETPPRLPVHVRLPNFAAIRTVNRRKREFFSYLAPIVADENAKILVRRRQLLELWEERGRDGRLHLTDRAWLRDL